MDPRCKLALSLVLFVFPLLSYRLTALAIDYIAALTIAIAGGFAVSLMRVQAPTAILATIISLSEVAAGYRALTAAATGLRFLDVITAASIFYLVTPTDEVGDVLFWLGVPEEALIWTVVSLRFVPTMARDLSMVIDAQSSRGMGAGGLIDWIRGLPSLVTPAIVISLIRGREVAEAMEIRGYRPGRQPSGQRWQCIIAIFLAVLLTTTIILAPSI
ncbi:energy-coupling factor transporter transmembrane component T family protein [Conexivisphaera calida]|uniref:energy-coupling factor transporter transmembrane component T family protein n=1 Tax=Conexivisphaera calida TaxID=1874277 RepID=UPI00157B1E74|nr:energy-coupling factor transporter transmembrane component T [Conexivisphaera calida]